MGLFLCSQAKILDHDNVTYLKKILGELAMVLDQVEAELEKRTIEYEGECRLLLMFMSLSSDITLSDMVAVSEYLYYYRTTYLNCTFISTI